MKKLMLLVALMSASSLYGASIGLGVAYDNLAGPEGTDPFLAIRGDILVKIIPVLGLRVGLINVELPEGAKLYSFGTGTYADFCLMFPTPMSIKPYIPVGVMYNKMDNAISTSLLSLKGGIGAMLGLATINAYIEGGIDFLSFDLDGVTESDNWFYVQGGLRFPIGLE